VTRLGRPRGVELTRAPADLRTRLERARLETLALLRALDQRHLAPRDLPQSALAHLAAIDADCAEALWALDQPVGTLDAPAMIRDTLASLDALADARAQVRNRLPLHARAPLERLEPVIRATLKPIEAYNDVPGRDPQNR
jgi:hypothetical protein